ncbi:hypothetical protein B0H19DRAFT_1382534 [Mycena capillaripes]|nr:hypothetical protein B0H19DRAFT_1382534 [Mycena capillaripes]
MDVEQKGDILGPTYVADPGDEAAAAKIWAVYVAEAEKYDKGLVASWRSDMEGMLIFAGLFSASLTAFLIESYKTLNDDPGDATVRLLGQISQQLTASVNGSTYVVPPPPEFTPSAAALACNALWFISLGLSLSCALIATLLEQWARDFIHRSEIRSAPLIRARIFSFLYYGLKRFNMHTVVEIIPLLLHMALLFFFAGLIAFLIPVNILMAAISATILIFITGAYSIFTFLPLRYLESPYRTPLSGTAWQAFQYLKIKWRRRHNSEGNHGTPRTAAEETIIGVIARVAVEPSEDRMARDERALIWTVKSLSDERELEPFVEAIPDVLWGPTGKRDTYSSLFRNLINNPDIGLGGRINMLYHSCNTGLLSSEATKRRKIICYKAVWAIVTLLDSPESAKVFLKSIGKWASYPSVMEDPEILHFGRSTEALIQWRTFQNDKFILRGKLQYLADCQAASGSPADLTPVLHFLDDLSDHRDYFVDNHGRNYIHGRSPISALVDDIHHILRTTPYLILFPYLRYASGLEALPYLFRRTVDIIRPPPGTPAAVRYDLDATLEVIVPIQLKRFNKNAPEWMDSVMSEVMTYWPQQHTPTSTLHHALIKYLNGRHWDKAVWTSISRIGSTDQLWNAFAESLENNPHAVNDTLEPPKKDFLSALWRLVSLGFSPNIPVLQRIIQSVTHLDAPSIGPSVIIVLKSRFLRKSSMELGPSAFAPIFPALTARTNTGDDNDGPSHFWCWRAEADLELYVEFLECCAGSDRFPHQAAATLRFIDVSAELSNISDALQIRFSNAILEVFRNPRCTDLHQVVVNSSLFDVYTESPFAEAEFWLNDETARKTLAAALETYLDEGSGSSINIDSPEFSRARVICSFLIPQPNQPRQS